MKERQQKIVERILIAALELGDDRAAGGVVKVLAGGVGLLPLVEREMETLSKEAALRNMGAFREMGAALQAARIEAALWDLAAIIPNDLSPEERKELREQVLRYTDPVWRPAVEAIHAD